MRKVFFFFFFFTPFLNSLSLTALVLHPDKVQNPTPETVREFERVQTSYEVLSDPEARRALDAVLGAQVRAAQKMATMNSARRQMQEDLERREREAASKSELVRAQAVLQQHMDRIRAENVARMNSKVLRQPLASEQPPARTEHRASNLVPYSQKFATLEEFEAFAFAKLESV